MTNTLRRFVDNLPTTEELNNFWIKFKWENMQFEKVNTFTPYTNVLMDTINELFSNGGIKINKYKLIGDDKFNYYIVTNKNFIENIHNNKTILEDRNYLKLNGELPKIKKEEHWSDIYTFSGYLARMMAHGGAYTHGIGQKDAWKIATEYVENEFKNDFEEYDFYYVIIENAGWFYDVAWDYSFIIVDKKIMKYYLWI
jgi:hypothetical protein